MKKHTDLAGMGFSLLFLFISIGFVSLPAQSVIQVSAGANQIAAAYAGASSGDTLELITSGGLYQEDSTLIIKFPINIKAATGLAEKPVFESADGRAIEVGSSLSLSGFKISGLFTDDSTNRKDSTKYAIRTADIIDYGYKLICEDMEFDHIIRGEGEDRRGYVFSADSAAEYASEINFTNCIFTRIGYRVLRFKNNTEALKFGLLNLENCTAADVGNRFLNAEITPTLQDTPRININHCTFYDIAEDVFRIKYVTDLTIKNCIFSNTGIVVHTANGTIMYSNLRNTGGITIWVNKTSEYNIAENPEFSAPENFDFSVSEQFARQAIGDDGLVIGDQRWAPQIENILYVPSDNYPTIQAGIDSSVNGDTVLIGVGTFWENINLKGRNILLGSRFILAGDTSYITQTTIDGDSLGSVVTVDKGEDSSCVISGFTITNGAALVGGGIHCYASSPIFEYLVVYGNTATYGGGLYYDSCINPMLVQCIIANNTSTMYGGGIVMINTDGYLDEVVIKSNQALSEVAGGINLWNSAPQLVNCLITDNKSYLSGGGLVCNGSSNAHMIHVTISNNISNNGAGGGLACGESSPVFLNSIISANEAPLAPWANEVDTWDDISEPVFNYCNTSLVLNGEGNIYEDPMFVDIENGDYHLSNLSPCIGIGKLSEDSDADLEGNPRPDPPGSKPDLGVFENMLARAWHATIKCSEDSITHVLTETEMDSLSFYVENHGLAALEYYISTDMITIADSQNYGLVLSDSGSYLDITNPDSFDFTAEFSMAAWVKTDSGGVIIAKTSGLDEPGPKTFFITGGNEWEDGVLSFDVGYIGGLEGTRFLNDNHWHHVAVTASYNGTNVLRLYVDGELDIEKNIDIDEYPETGFKLRIGFDGRVGDELPGFYGQIDEVSIWNRQLSQMELKTIMNTAPAGTESGLMGFWPMNEKAGTQCLDLSANENTATFMGNPERIISNVPYNYWLKCRPDYGYVLPGSQEEITVKVDAANLPEGDYLGGISFFSNDPDNPTTYIPFHLSFEPLGIEENKRGDVPDRFELSQNYPNPFNPKTVINYQLPIPNYVDLSIYNNLGQKVAILVSRKQAAGSYQIQWNAGNMASGVYYYKLQTASGFVRTKKLLLIK